MGNKNRLFACTVILGLLPGLTPFVHASGFSQLLSAQETTTRNRVASLASRRSGLSSIGRGRANMRSGRGRLGGAAQVALGALQIAEGLKGLFASEKATGVATKSAGNAARMGEVVGANQGARTLPASGTAAQYEGSLSGQAGAGGAASAASASSLASADSAPAPLNLKSSLFTTGEANEALIEIQEQYGIAPEEFLQSLASGADPRKLLIDAPLNPVEVEDAKEAYLQARASLAEEAKRALAESGTPPAETAAAAANTVAAKTADSTYDAAKQASRRSLLSRLAADGSAEEAEAAPELSPEVQAALAAREEKNRVPAATELTLFDVIHSKYQDYQRRLNGTDETLAPGTPRP